MNRFQVAARSIGAVRKDVADHISWDVIFSRHLDTADKVLSSPYSKSSIAYTCISTTGRAIGQVPLLVMRKTGRTLNMRRASQRFIENGERRYFDHKPGEPLYVWDGKQSGGSDLWEQVDSANPWQELIDNPNPLLAGSQFKEAIVGNMMIDGNVWVLGFPPSPKVIPDSIWVIQKGYMKPKRDKQTGQLIRWLYDPRARGDVGGGPQSNPLPIELDERIAHVKFWNPKDPILGLSPLEAGKMPMLADWKAARYNDKVFDNDCVMSGALETDTKMNPEQVKKLRADIERKHQGYDKAHQLLILHSGMKYHQTGVSHRDMEYMDFRKYTRDEIIQILGMKKGVISITENLPYAVMTGQKKEWWESTNIPIMRLVETVLSVQLMKNDPNMRVMYDLSTVKALQEDFKEKTEIAHKYWTMGMPFDVINERLELGFDKFPGSDTGYLPFSLMPAGDRDTESQEVPEEEPKRLEHREVKLITAGNDRWEEKGARIWKRFALNLHSLEDPFEKKLKKVFFEMRKNILSILHSGEPGKSKCNNITTKDLRGSLLAINAYNYKIEQDLLKKNVYGYFDMSVINGADSIIDELDLNMSFDLHSPMVQSYLTTKKMKVVGVLGTVKRKINKEVWVGFQMGEDAYKIAKRLKTVFSMANNRAKVIARTEVGGALNFGRYAQINESGFKQKRWYTAGDERVRSLDNGAEFDHSVMHRELLRIGYDSSWDVGGEALDYPGDYKGSPGNIIQCRCIEIVDTSEV